MPHVQLPHIVDNTLTSTTPATVAEAIDNYRDLALPIGVDAHGNHVAWPLRTAPHAMMFKTQSGTGLSTAVHTVITQAAHAGIRVVIADFLPSGTNFDLSSFQGWPNVHSATNSPYANVAAINTVSELLWQRRTTDPDEHEPVLLVVNGVGRGLDWLQYHAPTHDEYSRQDQWNHTAGDTLAPHTFTLEAIRTLACLGREFRIHLLLTEFGPTSRLNLMENMAWKLYCGPHTPDLMIALAAGWPAAPADDAAHSAVLRTHTDFDHPEHDTPLRVFWTPNPRTTLTADRELLESLRPERALYPAVTIDLPDPITSWDQVFGWAANPVPAPPASNDPAPAPSDTATAFLTSVLDKLDSARRAAGHGQQNDHLQDAGAFTGFAAAIDIVRATATEFGLHAPGES